jgi:dihydroxyacetone kinase
MWSESINEGVNAIMTYGGAKPGFRTMLDAFVPAVEALKAGDMCV